MASPQAVSSLGTVAKIWQQQSYSSSHYKNRGKYNSNLHIEALASRSIDFNREFSSVRMNNSQIVSSLVKSHKSRFMAHVPYQQGDLIFTYYACILNTRDSLGIINGYVKIHQLGHAKIPLRQRKVPSTVFFSYAKYHQRFEYHAKYLQWSC